MHAFGGSEHTAATLGRVCESAPRGSCRLYFGFSSRAARLRRAAAVMASVPADRILLESDELTAAAAPPALAEACARLALARGWTEQEAAQRTADNAHAAFLAEDWV